MMMIAQIFHVEAMSLCGAEHCYANKAGAVISLGSLSLESCQEMLHFPFNGIMSKHAPEQLQQQQQR